MENTCNTFAATLPLEPLKKILSQFHRRVRSQLSRAENSRPGRVKCALPYQEWKRVKHSAEDNKEGHVGKLSRTLYGTGEAADAGDEFFNDAAIDQGVQIGLSSPCLCLHREQDNDLVFEGKENWLDELHKEVERVMVLRRRAKWRCRASDDKHVTILNRLMDLHDTCGEEDVTLEPDPTTPAFVEGCVWAECDVTSGHDAWRQTT